MTAVVPKEKVDAKSSARKFRIRSHGRRLPFAGRASMVLVATPLPEHWGVLVETSYSGSNDVIITVSLSFPSAFWSAINTTPEAAEPTLQGGWPGSGRCRCELCLAGRGATKFHRVFFRAHRGHERTSPAGFRNI